MFNEETYLVSDTHFGHKNIIKYSPTRDVETKKTNFKNHDEFLVNKWNTQVKEYETIIHLGDLFMGKNESLKYLELLNGNKHIILGNHDNLKKDSYQYYDFKILSKYNYLQDCENIIEIDKIVLDMRNKFKFFNFILIEINGFRLLLSHFPIVDTQGYDVKYINQITALNKIFELSNCNYNIHGHTHYNEMDDERCINISVEKTNFEPIKIKDVIKNLIK